MLNLDLPKSLKNQIDTYNPFGLHQEYDRYLRGVFIGDEQVTQGFNIFEKYRLELLLYAMEKQATTCIYYLSIMGVRLRSTDFTTDFSGEFLPHFLAAFGHPELFSGTAPFHQEHVRDANGFLPIDYLFARYKADLPEEQKVGLITTMQMCARKMQQDKFPNFSLASLDPNLPLHEYQRIWMSIAPILPPVYEVSFSRNQLLRPEITGYFNQIILSNCRLFNTMVHTVLSSTQCGASAAITPLQVYYLSDAVLDHSSRSSSNNPLITIDQDTFASLVFGVSAAQSACYQNGEAEACLKEQSIFSPGVRALMEVKDPFAQGVSMGRC